MAAEEHAVGWCEQAAAAAGAAGAAGAGAAGAGAAAAGGAGAGAAAAAGGAGAARQRLRTLQSTPSHCTSVTRRQRVGGGRAGTRRGVGMVCGGVGGRERGRLRPRHHVRMQPALTKTAPRVSAQRRDRAEGAEPEAGVHAALLPLGERGEGTSGGWWR
eukprot:1056439-Rhodomonas_salina.1